jgi:hypothetical protein
MWAFGLFGPARAATAGGTLIGGTLMEPFGWRGLGWSGRFVFRCGCFGLAEEPLHHRIGRQRFAFWFGYAWNSI